MLNRVLDKLRFEETFIVSSLRRGSSYLKDQNHPGCGGAGNYLYWGEFLSTDEDSFVRECVAEVAPDEADALHQSAFGGRLPSFHLYRVGA